jgi:hypothetical protein
VFSILQRDLIYVKGAKAASKRDRKDKDVKVAKSQLKVVGSLLSGVYIGYTNLAVHIE